MKVDFSFRPRVLVVGDLMIDNYLWGSCSRISPEAPVQIIDISKENSKLGGAGNVIENLLAYKAKIDVASVIGNDNTGHKIISYLSAIGISSHMLLLDNNRTTSIKSRIIANNQQVIRFDKESKNSITKQFENDLGELISKNIKNYDLILISDYDKGVLTKNLCQKIIQIANQNDLKVLVDPKGKNYDKYKNSYLITPNKKEASIATGITINNDKNLERAGFKLKNKFNVDFVIITLSEDGVAIFANEVYKIPTKSRNVYDVTGAGDTVISTLAMALANKYNIEQSCNIANYAAAVVINKIGSATTSVEEINEYIKSYL